MVTGLHAVSCDSSPNEFTVMRPLCNFWGKTSEEFPSQFWFCSVGLLCCWTKTFCLFCFRWCSSLQDILLLLHLVTDRWKTAAYLWSTFYCKLMDSCRIRLFRKTLAKTGLYTKIMSEIWKAWISRTERTDGCNFVIVAHETAWMYLKLLAARIALAFWVVVSSG